MNDKLQTIPEIKSITDIVRYNNQLPKIRTADEREVNQAIGELILEVFNFYNETPNDIQLKLMLPVIKEAAKRLTLPDLRIFKNNCLQGHYPLKFRLTPNILIEWIKEYEFERMEAFANNNLKVKIEIEKQPISPKTLEMLKELADKVKKKVLPNEPRELSVYEIESQMIEQEIKRVESYLGKEFREIWKKDKLVIQLGLTDIPYVIYHGTKMFADAYLKARYAEIIEQTKGDLNEINKLIK